MMDAVPSPQFTEDRGPGRQRVDVVHLGALEDALPVIVGGPFICFCAIDSTGASVRQSSRLCVWLLDSGCAYFHAWGPGSERLHDLMDEEVVGGNPPETDRGNVVTVWDESGSLDVALERFLGCEPNASFAPGDRDRAMIVTVGHDEWSAVAERTSRANNGRRHP